MANRKITGAEAPFLVGGGAVVAALLLLFGARLAGAALSAMAVLSFLLLAIEYLTGGPGMTPLEIGGVPFRGSLFVLPIALIFGPFVYFFSSRGTEAEKL